MSCNSKFGKVCSAEHKRSPLGPQNRTHSLPQHLCTPYLPCPRHGIWGWEERGDRLIHSTNISCLLCAGHCFGAEDADIIR